MEEQMVATAATERSVPLRKQGPRTYVIFDLFDQPLGVDVQSVREILSWRRISVVPNAPHGISGVIDVRGRCVPIYDLSAWTGGCDPAERPEARIIIFDLPGIDGTGIGGIVAERVRDVAAIDASAIEPAPNGRTGSWTAPGVVGATRLEADLIFLISVGDFLKGLAGIDIAGIAAMAAAEGVAS